MVVTGFVQGTSLESSWTTSHFQTLVHESSVPLHKCLHVCRTDVFRIILSCLLKGFSLKVQLYHLLLPVYLDSRLNVLSSGIENHLRDSL